MKKEIVYTDKYALILSDEKGKKNCWVLVLHSKTHPIHFIESLAIQQDNKEIIGHRPLTDDAPILEGVPLLPPLPQGDYIEDLSKNEVGWYDKNDDKDIVLFIEGYNKAKEKYKYTEEDVRRAIEMSKDIKYVTFSIDEIIQSLQQPSRPTHFECEMEYKDMVGGWYNIDKNSQLTVDKFGCQTRIKTTTNSQGQEVACGKYIY